MVNKNSVVGFAREVAGTPMSNRKSGVRNRTTSLFMRAVALGFLAGLATSIALWIYEKSAQRQAAG